MSQTSPNENILLILDNQLSNLLHTWEEFLTLQKFDQTLPPTFKKRFLTDFETFYTNIADKARLYPEGKLKIWPFEQLKSYITLFLDFFEYSENILLLFKKISTVQTGVLWQSLLNWEDSLVLVIQQESMVLGKKLVQIDKSFVKFFYNRLYAAYITDEPNNKFIQLLDNFIILGHNLSRWGEALQELPFKLTNTDDCSNKLHDISNNINKIADFFTHDFPEIKNFFDNLYELSEFAPPILKCQSNHEKILKNIVEKGLFGDKLFETELQKQIHIWDELLIDAQKVNTSDVFKKYEMYNVDQWIVNQQYLKDLSKQHQQFREKLADLYWVKTKEFKLTECIQPILEFVKVLHTHPKDKLPQNLQQILNTWSKLHLDFVEWFQLSNQSIQTYQFLGNWISSSIQMPWNPLLVQELEQLSKQALKYLYTTSLSHFLLNFLNEYGHDFLPLITHFQEKYTFIPAALEDIENWRLVTLDDNTQKEIKDIIDAMTIFFTRNGWQESAYIFNKLKQVYENELITLIKEFRLGFAFWTKYTESRWENTHKSKSFLTNVRESCLTIQGLLPAIYPENHPLLSNFENQLKKIDYLGIIMDTFDQPFILFFSKLGSNWGPDLQQDAKQLEEHIFQIKKTLDMNILGKEKYPIMVGEYVLLWTNMFSKLIKFFSSDFLTISTQQNTISTIIQSWDALYQKSQTYNEYIPKNVFNEYQRFIQHVETVKELLVACMHIQTSYSNMLDEYPQLSLEDKKKYFTQVWKTINTEFDTFKVIGQYFNQIDKIIRKYQTFLEEMRQIIECSGSIDKNLDDIIDVSTTAPKNQQKIYEKLSALLKKDLDTFFGLPDPKTILGEKYGSKLQEKYQDLYSLLESNKDLPTLQQLKNVKDK